MFNRDFSFLLLSGVLASPRYICVASLSDKKGKRFSYVTYGLRLPLDVLLLTVPNSQQIVSEMVPSHAL